MHSSLSSSSQLCFRTLLLPVSPRPLPADLRDHLRLKDPTAPTPPVAIVRVVAMSPQSLATTPSTSTFSISPGRPSSAPRTPACPSVRNISRLFFMACGPRPTMAATRSAAPTLPDRKTLQPFATFIPTQDSCVTSGRFTAPAPAYPRRPSFRSPGTRSTPSPSPASSAASITQPR